MNHTHFTCATQTEAFAELTFLRWPMATVTPGLGFTTTDPDGNVRVLRKTSTDRWAWEVAK